MHIQEPHHCFVGRQCGFQSHDQFTCDFLQLYFHSSTFSSSKKAISKQFLGEKAYLIAHVYQTISLDWKVNKQITIAWGGRNWIKATRGRWFPHTNFNFSVVVLFVLFQILLFQDDKQRYLECVIEDALKSYKSKMDQVSNIKRNKYFANTRQAFIYILAEISLKHPDTFGGGKEKLTNLCACY